MWRWMIWVDPCQIVSGHSCQIVSGHRCQIVSGHRSWRLPGVIHLEAGGSRGDLDWHRRVAQGFSKCQSIVLAF